jgi:coenzyme F420-reducing hydrogenase alpha subunit
VIDVPDEEIVVALRCRAGRVDSVEVKSTRLTRAAAALVGRTPVEATTLAPLLFPVCGRAHAVALTEACEKALGQRQPPEAELRRALEVAVEQVVSHATHIALGFAAALGEKPDTAVLAKLRHAADEIGEAAGGGGVAGAFGAPLAPVDAPRLEAAVSDLCEVAERLAEELPESLDGIVAWADAAETTAARLVREAMREGFSRLGDVDVGALQIGAEDEAELSRALEEPSFASRPTLGGEPRDPSSFAMLTHHPILAALRPRFGAGLAARLVARLVALRVASEEVAGLVAELGDGDPAEAGPRMKALAAVRTARGPLVYRVVLRDGRIADAQTLAPTEWAFHPDGPLRTLVGLDRELAGEGAPLLVTALDPCVHASVRFEEVGHA